MSKETKFYTYSQNNSGGYFEKNKKDGIAEYVVIEALSEDKAYKRLKKITSDYRNYCECCGERWSEYTWDEGNEPIVCGKTIKEHQQDKSNSIRTGNIAIHYLDKLVWYEDSESEPKVINL